MPSRTAIDGVQRFAAMTRAAPRTIVVAGTGYGQEIPEMRELWKDARIIGVEPVKENRRRMLRTNCWQGKLDDLFGVALAGATGTAEMHLNYEPDQRATFYDTIYQQLPDEITRTVETWTLDDLQSRTGAWEAPALLWLDAQGAERQILLGASDAALEPVRWINCEVELLPAREIPTAAEMHEAMASRGYRPAYYHSLGKQGHTIDVVYVRHEEWMAARRLYAERSVARKVARKQRIDERRGRGHASKEGDRSNPSEVSK